MSPQQLPQKSEWARPAVTFWALLLGFIPPSHEGRDTEASLSRQDPLKDCGSWCHYIGQSREGVPACRLPCFLPVRVRVGRVGLWDRPGLEIDCWGPPLCLGAPLSWAAPLSSPSQHLGVGTSACPEESQVRMDASDPQRVARAGASEY